MLLKEFSFIKESIKFKEKENLKISKANVGWHLDHSLKVINSVYDALKISNPKDYKKEFVTLRLITFALGRFPRGRVKSPKRVLPPELILKEDLESQLELVIKNLDSLKQFNKNQYFTHPLFKHLNKKQTVKFLKLHTKHHLKIVKDILK
ncbi:MAG: DUF1569 domain-containing protein [Polaribacter sp.]|uniref:DUF1569 domain-containing protein n=1 Tax=Polaribacter sp. TaxID=1920175 RepID=UPI003BB01F9C